MIWTGGMLFWNIKCCMITQFITRYCGFNTSFHHQMALPCM